METVVKFRDWVFLVDQAATQAAYAAIARGGADECTCEDCRNFAQQRPDLYPAEVRELFTNLGIDYNKESEVYTVDKMSNGFRQYYGWLHFRGKILAGEDCSVPFRADGSNMEFAKITDNFSVGFTDGYAPSIFKDSEGLVQIELATLIPWLAPSKHV